MYQVFCMQGTPPVSWEEQDKCMHSKTSCWRLAANKEPQTSTDQSPSSASR